MVPILTAVIILLVSVHIILGFNSVGKLVPGGVFAQNIPNNKVSESSLILTPIIPSPPKTLGLPPPSLSAHSALVKDITSGALIFAHMENKRVPIASTTKIMTALIATSVFQSNDILEVKSLDGVSGASMGLILGERISFRSLLYGMLLNSGNDAAFTIAHNFPGGFKAFIESMNQKAKELKLINTHFDNPAGFDSSNHYSSAFDLSVIASEAANNPQILRIVSTKEAQVSSSDQLEIHNLKNLNKLLNTEGVLGFKTGFTPAAKENFVGLVERSGHRIITVVLGSDDRFGETLKLINWTYSNFIWE